MPYIIAAIVVVIGAVAFTFMQSEPATEAETTVTEEVRSPDEEMASEPAPETENAVDIEVEAEASASSGPAPESEPDISVVSEVNTDIRATDPDLTAFNDGTYTTQTSYFTPRRTEHVMDVTLTIENSVVTEAEILWDGEAEAKTPNHSSFDGAYKAEVVGQPLDEIFLSRVGGASLTSEAFNEAIQTIEVEASTS